MNETFVVEGLGGKKTLEGTISVTGAKNAALKTMAASLLFRDTVTIKNVPDIEDIKRMADLLGSLGCSIERKNHHTYRIIPSNALRPEMDVDISKRMRSSVLVTGPLLARLGKVVFPHPGGCVIGERPIDIFLEGFEKMGATVREGKDHYVIQSKGKLKGARLFMRTQSVTATETFMMTAVLASGMTTIENAATEPEIEDLALFLNERGAKISGAGTHTITIKGNGLLHARGKEHVTMPDRIEAGSFLVLAALAGKDVTIKGCNPDHLGAVIAHLSLAGVKMDIKKNSIRITQKGNPKSYKAVNIKTHEYPGFPTDLQAPMTVFLTQAHGESLVFETIFEGRLSYTESLITMGADITMMDPHRVLVRGATPLKGRNLLSPDLRAGLAFVIAAIVARGKSHIGNVYNIDRGYEAIEKRLAALGVSITRTM